MNRRGYAKFTSEIYSRLKDGEKEYKDKSFDRPFIEIIEEIQEEILDVAGWGFIDWIRMENLKEKMKSLPLDKLEKMLKEIE